MLRLAGAALVTGLAGCSTAQRREASPVALDGGGPSAQYGLERVMTPTRTVSPDGLDVEVTVVSHAASYHREGQGFLTDVGAGLLATPTMNDVGQSLNPLANRPLADLLTSDVARPLVEELGVESGWATTPTPVGQASGPLLGTETTVETFAGHTNDDELALVGMTRVSHDGDAVLVGTGRTRPLAEGEASRAADSLVSANERREAAQSLVDLLPHVVRESPGAAPTDTPTPAPTGTTTTPRADLPPGRIPIDEVPRAIRRRGARFVERAVGDEATWPDGAELGAYAHRVGRPDVDGVAYYELEVEPEGFLVCATGEHDAPIPHWSSSGRSMGRVLEERAEGGPLARLVWIDRQRYVAEDPDGNRIATRGNAVPRIRNVEALADAPESVARARYGPETDVPDDDVVGEDYEGVQLAAENQVEPPDVSLERWESHDQLMENYEAAYRPLLADLRERAAAAWETYRERGGESRNLGTDRTEYEPLLPGQTVAEIAETTRDAFRVERVARETGHDVVTVVPTGTASAGEVVRLAFEDAAGEREAVEYRAVDPVDDPEEPVDLDVVEDAAAALDGRDVLPARYWAGGAGLQPWYYQWDYQGCKVGCGPVAWGILFAWVDRQADGGQFNGTWWPRWGIYRENGGYGRDAVAPRNADSNPYLGSQGVRNMIEELNGHVDVFCLGDSGATAPWDMDEARNYLWGRTGTDLEVHHSWTGRPKRRCRIETKESIRGSANGKGKTPVVVGKGWLSHYPVAYAYRTPWVDDVKVNNGWGPSSDEQTEWIWAQTWFSGETYP